MQKDAKDEKPQRPDPIISILGSDLGRWQLYVCLWIFLSKPPTGWVQISMVFLQSPVKATCKGGGGGGNGTDVCEANCDGYDYDHSIFEQNIIMEWDLLCDRRWIQQLAQSLVMVGIMLGNMIMGLLADRWGRRPMFVSSCMLQLVSGCLVSASPWLWFFMLMRFLDGYATGGTMSTGFTIIMEIVGKSKREMMAILYQIPFNLGHATLPLFAYFLRHWRWYHLSFSSFSIVYILFFWTVPESPRWLVTTGRTDAATALLEKAAARNNQPTDRVRHDVEEAQKAVASATAQKGSLADLFKYGYLCQKTIAMAFNWLVVCLVYYGLSQYMTSLTGNMFLNILVAALMGVPGTCLCVPATKYMGRRFTLFLSNLTSGVSLTLLAFGHNFSGIVQVILATIGLFGASVTFPNVYLYAGELFPTVVRPTGVGLCSFVGRVGSIIAPWIEGLKQKHIWIPPAFFGGFALLAAASVFLMPETKGYPLPETIEDGNTFGKKPKPTS
ncbi:organic cation transporter protein-like isoform X1 [Anastrepha ludens]|uniref:organic cation transporter protein-like isoform X1 n=2 Tax=Anastrepha ludens TaxID=28586 RepID=UPI0023B151CE|nr:organic cation transporter protein-like isoform X1 [Anastrepha ludens]